jgi:multisubunit Na+/H+ antiporter MnhF subunit
MSFIGTLQKVFGVFGIIGGAFISLGIITAILGIPMIIAGVKLFLSGEAFKQVANTADVNNIKAAIINLASYWLYTLIYLAIIIVFYIVVFIIVISEYHSYYM